MQPAEDLASYTRLASEAPWVWACTDCTSWLAPHVEARLGGPVGRELRAQALDGRSVRRLMMRHGGLIALADRLLGAFGVARTTTPRDGDVGVVSVVDGKGRKLRLGALYVADRWVVRTGDGHAALLIEADAAWRLPLPGETP